MTLHSSFAMHYAYPVCFTRMLFGAANPVLAEVLAEHPVRKLLIVAEAAVLAANPGLEPAIRLKYAQLQTQFVPVPDFLQVFSGGEHRKTWEDALKIASALEQAGLCRHSAVLCIGGGAFLDTVGFAASLTHRGVRLIRVPSTTLSQCDSGVGVKNGVNAFGKKNFLGVFDPPFAVLNDSALTDCLPDAAFRAGFPEALKVAMIADAEFYGYLLRHADALRRREPEPVDAVIRHSAELHARHIAENGDPFERGSARPLDFGHWAAHKLEAMSGYSVGHGEAVSLGIALDTFIACELGFVPASVLTEVRTFFRQLGFEAYHPLLGKRLQDGSLEILRGLDEFREHLGGALSITFPAPVGAKKELHHLAPDQVERAVAFLETQA